MLRKDTGLERNEGRKEDSCSQEVEDLWIRIKED
jgi:hypothetical protein